MTIRRLYLLFLTAAVFSIQIKAAHIVGGEIYYQCTSGNSYDITLKVYRDCFGGGASFDDPGRVYVFDVNDSIVATLLATPSITNLNPQINNPCLVAPPNVCVEEAIYLYSTTLPPSAGGYYLVYQRCCRNGTIANLTAPGTQGATYFERIPDPGLAQCNGSPVFNNFPPIVVCANDPLIFDHSATDPDGDSLVYKFCDPYVGASQANPLPIPASDPPYNKVTWDPGYSAANPVDANPNFTIDPQSGLLTGTPTQLGQYVVGVCADEYRNGVLIGTHQRDFQFNMANCDPLVIANIPSPNNDTIIHCDEFTVAFGNNSINGSTWYWDFGDPLSTSDTSDVEFPTYTYSDTGTFTVMLVANPYTSCADTDYVTLIIYPFLIPDFDIDAACKNEPFTFTDLSTTTLGTIIFWEWDFGDSQSSLLVNPTHVYTSDGFFNVTLTVRTDLGCERSITKLVRTHPSPVSDFSFSTPCLDFPTDFTDLSSIVTGSIAAWNWDFGDGSPPSTQQHPGHTFTSPGNYVVTLVTTSDLGCMDTISKMLSVSSPPEAQAWSDTVICWGDTVQLNASGSFFYSWEPAEGLSRDDIPRPLAFPKTTTTYTVTVSDQCYSDTATVTIVVNALPVVTAYQDTLIMLGDSVTLDGLFNQDIISWIWNPPYKLVPPSTENDQDITVAPELSKAYILTVTDINGCTNSDTAIVLVRSDGYVKIPNAFTPNNDGLNDLIEVLDQGNVELLYLRIYNRWGQLIFETDDISRGWDGRYNGEDQPVGVYTYIVRYRVADLPVARTQSGNITLLR